MEVRLRDWRRDDLKAIAAAWLGTYDPARFPGVPLQADAPRAMEHWLGERFADRSAIGLVIEVEDDLAGFLLARCVHGESEPPIVPMRRVCLIDAVWVHERRRRCGFGSRLVTHVLEKAAARGVSAVETTYETADPASRALWRKMGFHPWIERAYLVLNAKPPQA